MKKQLLPKAPLLALLTTIAFITSSCINIKSILPGGGSDSPKQPLPASTRSSSTLEQSTTSTDSAKVANSWLIQPGLFGFAQGLWLSSISLVLGAIGTGLSLRAQMKLDQLTVELHGVKRNLRKLEGEKPGYATTGALKEAVNNITGTSDQIAKEVANLQEAYKRIYGQYSFLSSTVKQQSLLSNVPSQGPSYADANWSSSQTFPPHSQSPTADQLQFELTAAINREDRQVIKNSFRAQLNITNASENDIMMGRMTGTQLEEVGAGGSYLLATIAGVDWLYPTNQTLKGFAQYQPPKGIYTYNRQSIPSPQVIAPARLAAVGNGWQIEEMGTIAVPS